MDFNVEFDRMIVNYDLSRLFQNHPNVYPNQIIDFKRLFYKMNNFGNKMFAVKNCFLQRGAQCYELIKLRSIRGLFMVSRTIVPFTATNIC